MPSYTRRQLFLLLLFVACAGAGLAIARWRDAHPDVVEQLESFDQAAPESVPGTPAKSVPGGPTPTRPQRTSGPKRVDAAARDRLAPGEALDLNHASAADLRRLPGVGPVLAGRIVESRQANGPFTSIDDLRRVTGIGASKLDRLRALITVSQ
jgi:competence protein ComEA